VPVGTKANIEARRILEPFSRTSEHSPGSMSLRVGVTYHDGEPVRCTVNWLGTSTCAATLAKQTNKLVLICRLKTSSWLQLTLFCSLAVDVVVGYRFACPYRG
jgi:hypothetical protein